MRYTYKFQPNKRNYAILENGKKIDEHKTEDSAIKECKALNDNVGFGSWGTPKFFLQGRG